MNDTPLIISFVSDLWFAPQIEQVARHIGFRLQRVERAEQFVSSTDSGPTSAPGEPLEGPLADLVDSLARAYPALLLFDLNNAAIPWFDWISTIKSVAATRRIPILCFGSHVEVETLTRAKEAGADQVIARSRFIQTLPDLLKKMARIPDQGALARACTDSLSNKAIKGITLFNAGEYFDAHEELEEAWHADGSAARELYRALLQAAVAYLQIERGNYRGALKMFLRLQQWLGPLPDRCRGVDVAQLRADTEHVHEKIKQLGPEGIDQFERAWLKPILADFL